MGILNQHNLVDVRDRAIDTGVMSKQKAAAAIAEPGAVAGAAGLADSAKPAAFAAPVPPANPITSDLGKNEVYPACGRAPGCRQAADRAGNHAYSPLRYREAG